MALARQLWQASQADLDFTSLVFVDETGTNTAMTRTHGGASPRFRRSEGSLERRSGGWCTKGEPLIDKVPHRRWKTLTFIAGLKYDGIIAPYVFDDPINPVLSACLGRQSKGATSSQRGSSNA